MTILVRPATIADAAHLSHLGAATFRETFERENTPEDMARYLAKTFTPERQAAEIADPAGTVLLAEARGESGGAELVGYAATTQQIGYRPLSTVAKAMAKRRLSDAEISALRSLSASELATVELDPSGGALRWDELDVDLSVPGLLLSAVGVDERLRHFASLAGRVRSDAKARAARTNGKKGGRPKRT